MIIKNILNNNFAIVEHKGVEKIVMGRGIAFNKKVGQKAEQNRIQKIFILTNSDFGNKLTYLINNLPNEIFQVVTDIIQYYTSNTDKTVSDSVYLTLSDHLNFSITRSKTDYYYKNVLLWDIQNFYPKEYEAGLFGLKRMNQVFNLELPVEEAGFITLHLLNADIGYTEPGDIQRVIQIIQEVTDSVHYYFGIDFDTNSMQYQRFITHVRFFAQRVVLGMTNEEQLGNEDLLELIQDKYTETYKCVLLLEKHINKKYNFPLSSEEKMYLILHIQRILQNDEDKNNN